MDSGGQELFCSKSLTEYLSVDTPAARRIDGGNEDTSVPVVCQILRTKGGRLTRKQGQIIPRGDQRWLVRVSLGRDPVTRRRKYRSRTICGSFRAAQHHLNNQLEERDQGRELAGDGFDLEPVPRPLARARCPAETARNVLPRLPGARSAGTFAPRLASENSRASRRSTSRALFTGCTRAASRREPSNTHMPFFTPRSSRLCAGG